MLEVLTEETERSLYLDTDSKTVDPDHALWCSMRLIHKMLTIYFHLNITLRRLWNISTIMSNHRNNKTSFHVKFEGIGFRNYKIEQKFKAILNYPDELNLRENGKPIIDLYAMGKSKQYMRMPNQGKKYGESGFKVLKIAKNVINNVGDFLYGIYDDRKMNFIDIEEILTKTYSNEDYIYNKNENKFQLKSDLQRPDISVARYLLNGIPNIGNGNPQIEYQYWIEAIKYSKWARVHYHHIYV